MISYIEGDKDALINPFYLEPGTQGGGIIVPGSGTTTVYLDLEFREGYRDGDLHPSLTYSQDPVLKDHFGYDQMRRARTAAEDATGTRYNARFYERVLSELFGEEIDIKHIMTGVTTFTGEHYHDLGYLATGRARKV